MRFLGPTSIPRFNEAAGLVYLAGTLCYVLCLVSYHPLDPSFNSAVPAGRALNLFGIVGAHIADLSLQCLGMGAFVAPVFMVPLAWKWLRSSEIQAPAAKLLGAASFLLATCAMLALGPDVGWFDGLIKPGGVAGYLLAGYLEARLNMTGAVMAAGTCMLLSLYLVSSFSVFRMPHWLLSPFRALHAAWVDAVQWRRTRKLRKQDEQARREGRSARPHVDLKEDELNPYSQRSLELITEPEADESEIPIRTLYDEGGGSAQGDAPPFEPTSTSRPAQDPEPEPSVVEYVPPPPARVTEKRPPRHAEYQFPPTSLLSEPEGRNPYDAQELKEVAARIKSKFEEFKILGSVVQINPGPVVTTFEFKPEAGIKYSRIVTLNEDLCLGLHAESILIERIPGKPTVGIEVPNKKRELIALRELLESPEFENSPSKLTMSFGKDVNGRIKVSSMETMPHLLIAGSTGSGKSVMLNCIIMSILFKATPEEVRLILVDPKQVEMGVYEGIPHLLTPVITRPELATNALRNAVLEMERRLKLLASQGARNIDQYNRKVRQKMLAPLSLFEEEDQDAEPLEPLPYILIVIDELADLMIQERANVESAITRLAQMARAVGIHLVVATQRHSVDVITGLIKANFPARLSFRVATRVDSRTILDVMGAEHLLGKGDMLLLPNGSSRLVRLHSGFCTEAEIAEVVNFWKQQANPDYDQSYLLPPPGEDAEAGDEDLENLDDPMYEEAVRTVLEMGKASTSILQRRLRLGYGRAASILDFMYREGIIGPPDGSRPREVLKRPDWLREVEDQVR